MVFHEADPTTFLALITMGMAIATSVLAFFTYLSVRAIRQQTSMAYRLARLQNLYTPLHEEFLRYEEGLGEWWHLGTGGLGGESEHNPWLNVIEPLMAQHGHLATTGLSEIYEGIVRLGPFPEGDDVEKREERLLSFRERAEADYRTIRGNLRKAARVDP